MSMIGKEIGIYRITDRLGQGGMGVVFKALDINLERTVAIKLLNSEVAEMPELVERFRAEARVQAGLSHPNLATLYAFLVWEGRPVMVMEFIEGETFQSMIARRGPIPAQVAVPMFRQALQGMGAAHHRGIIHRDIKPANLMMNNEGVVKVMDFGIAKVLGVSSATRTNMQMGTSLYMSPEQIMTNSIDARADIYSLGVTLYELLAGQVPFLAESDFAVQMAHMEKVPDSPTVHYPHIPPQIVAATMKALEKKPENRFQSVEEFFAALRLEEDGTLAMSSFATPIPGLGFPTPFPGAATRPPISPGPSVLDALTKPIGSPGPGADAAGMDELGKTTSLRSDAVAEPMVAPPPPPPPPALGQTFPPTPPPPTPPPPPLNVATPFRPPLPSGSAPGMSKGVLFGGGAALLLVLGGGLYYANVVSKEREVQRERVVAQRQEAENARQAALRQEREEKARAEEQRTAQELSDRVKQEQAAAASEAESQEKVRRDAAAAAAATQAAARQNTVPRVVREKSAVVPQPTVNTSAAAYQKISGIWVGSYVCTQGTTAARMMLNATPQGVTARFAFAVPNGKPGTFDLNGQFSPGNGQLVLQFVRWEVQPPNYIPANLAGIVELNQGTFTGRVLAPGCGAITMRHQ